MSQQPRYVITGSAGGGTGWGARIMSRLGSPCGHQRVFGRFEPIHDRDGESSWMAVGQLPEVPTVVLVRDPLRVVRSMTQQLRNFLTDDDPAHASTGYVRDVLPEVFEAGDQFGRVLRYVAWWDQIPDDRLRRVRIEAVGARQLRIMYKHLTGQDISAAKCRTAMTGVGSSVNSHGGPKSPITWGDIRAHPDGGEVVAKARRWGYL